MYQPFSNLADVPFRTLRSLSKAVVSSVLPEAEVNQASPHEGTQAILILSYLEIFRSIQAYLDIYQYITHI